MSSVISLPPADPPKRPTAPDALLLTVPAFAKRVSASAATVRKWIALGMPACRVDRHWRVELEPALAWMRRSSP